MLAARPFSSLALALALLGSASSEVHAAELAPATAASGATDATDAAGTSAPTSATSSTSGAASASAAEPAPAPAPAPGYAAPGTHASPGYTDPAPAEQPRAASPSPPPSTATERVSAGRSFRHEGPTVDLGMGALGCISNSKCGTAFAAENKPGFEIHGFVGRNIRGFVEPGVRWAWGRYGATYPHNVSLEQVLQPELRSQLLPHAGRIIDASSRVFEMGPLVRVHLVPWSRVIAYAGTGVSYMRWRQVYATSEGESRFDYHTLVVPLQAALGYFVTKHIAIGFEFTYRWSWHGNVIARYRPGMELEVFTERGAHDLVRFGQQWVLGAIGRVRF